MKTAPSSAVLLLLSGVTTAAFAPSFHSLPVSTALTTKRPIGSTTIVPQQSTQYRYRYCQQCPSGGGGNDKSSSSTTAAWMMLSLMDDPSDMVDSSSRLPEYVIPLCVGAATIAVIKAIIDQQDADTAVGSATDTDGTKEPLPQLPPPEFITEDGPKLKPVTNRVDDNGYNENNDKPDIFTQSKESSTSSSSSSSSTSAPTRPSPVSTAAPLSSPQTSTKNPTALVMEHASTIEEQQQSRERAERRQAAKAAKVNNQATTETTSATETTATTRRNENETRESESRKPNASKYSSSSQSSIQESNKTSRKLQRRPWLVRVIKKTIAQWSDI